MAAQSETFVSNQTFFLVYQMSQWAQLYDLTQGIFRMHARLAAGNVNIVYGWSSSANDNVGGTIQYDATNALLYIVAPYADMLALAPFAGVFDLQFTSTNLTILSYPLVQDLATGSITVSDGVTLS